jgi:hypothetical protein
MSGSLFLRYDILFYECYAPLLKAAPTPQVSILPFSSCTYSTMHRKNDPI